MLEFGIEVESLKRTFRTGDGTRKALISPERVWVLSSLDKLVTSNDTCLENI